MVNHTQQCVLTRGTSLCYKINEPDGCLAKCHNWTISLFQSWTSRALKDGTWKWTFPKWFFKRKGEAVQVCTWRKMAKNSWFDSDERRMQVPTFGPCKLAKLSSSSQNHSRSRSGQPQSPLESWEQAHNQKCAGRTLLWKLN